MILYYLAVTAVAISVLMDNRNPLKTMGWVLVLYLVPVGGMIVYMLFGQNYRKAKLFSRKGVRESSLISAWEQNHLSNIKKVDDLARRMLQEKWKVVQLLLNSDRSVATLQNEAQILRNGEQTFPSILEAIDVAKDHIHIEYYIIEDDEVGRKFQEKLIQKAREGVEIRMIYDDVGSSGLKKRYLKPMSDAGIELRPFMPVLFPLLTSKANFRDHRKIVIIDGSVGFVGGINLSSRYDNRTDLGRFWRDTHLKIKGDAVKSLQLHFFLMWKFVNESTPELSEKYFPDVQVDNLCLIQVAASGPDSDWPYIQNAFFAAITSAKERLWITTPYFIPTDEILLAIQTAAMSGVDVQMILPSRSDNPVVQAAVMSYVKQLLLAGVKVYLYQKGFVHSKTMIVDDMLCSIGTANMDYRSFDINFEINAFIYDPDMVNELVFDFEADRKDSSEITLARWEKRKLRRRVSESFARLISPVL